MKAANLIDDRVERIAASLAYDAGARHRKIKPVLWDVYEMICDYRRRRNGRCTSTTLLCVQDLCIAAMAGTTSEDMIRRIAYVHAQCAAAYVEHGQAVA